MTRSAYAVTSALSVECPPWSRGDSGMLESCGSPIGKHCIRTDGTTAKVSHSARRKLADEQRTREVNPEVMKP